MSNIFEAIFWTRPKWLSFVYAILVFVIALFFYTHINYQGSILISLDSKQIDLINKNVDTYSDTTDLLKVKRNEEIKMYMEKAMNLDLTQKQYSIFLIEVKKLSNTELKQYLANKKLRVISFFWLTDPIMYLEVLFWSLIGVLVSLIFYVSTKSNIDENDDIGPFKQSEIAGQLAKMFYSPIVTVVVVIGYTLFTDGSIKVDLSIGKGVIVFAFISGFYSGRLMKFLDKFKDLLLPNTGTKTEVTNTDKTKINEDTSKEPRKGAEQLPPIVPRSLENYK